MGRRCRDINGTFIYNDIRIAAYWLISNAQSNEILGYEYINTYGDINDNNTSILILININNNIWVLGYYNRDNVAQINNFIIFILTKHRTQANI